MAACMDVADVISAISISSVPSALMIGIVTDVAFCEFSAARTIAAMDASVVATPVITRDMAAVAQAACCAVDVPAALQEVPLASVRALAFLAAIITLANCLTILDCLPSMKES